MLKVKRSLVIEKLQTTIIDNKRSYRDLVNDALEGQGKVAMAFLVKRGHIKFQKNQLKEELSHMVENSLMNIGQWEDMLILLENASNGCERITAFMRKRHRIMVV